MEPGECPAKAFWAVISVFQRDVDHFSARSGQFASRKRQAPVPNIFAQRAATEDSKNSLKVEAGGIRLSGDLRIVQFLGQMIFNIINRILQPCDPIQCYSPLSVCLHYSGGGRPARDFLCA